MSIDEVFELTKIDRWFLHNIEQIVEEAERSAGATDCDLPFARKEARLFRSPDSPSLDGIDRSRRFAHERKAAGVIPTYRLVDTCAAEFEAYTPYYYSTYGTENEMRAERRSARS